ncbi:MAG TPA: glycoside hydrolase family 38 C-terminal domain-containing protein [Mucilaginibacter sp.]|jgi:alpha-mannosidase|nr:glycoside hydrolase family 38 C-terminal domain-containing protein [Mucilaginibacter sp.]
MKKHLPVKNLKRLAILAMLGLAVPLSARSQDTTYYIDGYHGGVWGHYPDWNTRFMVDMLKKHPYWNINLEIEPETWDRAARVDPVAYSEFRSMISGSGYTGRIEYVNPAYAQSYLFNIDGESIIRQFAYGMKMLRSHFPGITFTSYSSEEPCFTSALPQILTSFGIKYASLKNPNTCFGGYTRAHGGELVSWEGPDGGRILTVPRYENEKLLPGSTWQTIAWNNSPQYIQSSFGAGIKHPIGMTLQDAGWKGGPFLGGGNEPVKKNKYVTWRQYFDVVRADPAPVWKVSQEDVLVSLVWGSQVTQRIAQQVRTAENKLIGAEKVLALIDLYQPHPWPQAKLDSAWRTLLLSQHHDCWIVPYNGKPGSTWADKVLSWTNNSDSISDSLVNRREGQAAKGRQSAEISVFNAQLHRRREIVEADVPAEFANKKISIIDEKRQKVASQIVADSTGHNKILFLAAVPGFGVSKFSFALQNGSAIREGARAIKLQNGDCKLETDLYRLIISSAHGGSIMSLYDKQLNKEFIDQHDTLGFNTLRGNFYQDGGLKKSDQSPAEIKILENGPVRVKVQVSGTIDNTPWTQTIALSEHQRIIDVGLNINWQHNVGIGETTPPGTYDWKNYHKAFYDDRNKLLAVFPLSLKGQRVYKNAPFDVTESRLRNTFYTSWDSIKNNVLLNWVDVTDVQDQYGMALFTDHTTAYVHGEHFPLGLVVQYSGMGLWGRNYTINGPTHIHYALMPHKGKWDQAKIWSASADWNQPLVAIVGNAGFKMPKPMIASSTDGLVLSAAKTEGDDFTMRVFNAEGTSGLKSIRPNFKYDRAVVRSLDGVQIEALKPGQDGVTLNIPRFGIRTIEFIHMRTGTASQ